MNPPLRIGPDGLVEVATSREVKHLNHYLKGQPTPEFLSTPVGNARPKKRRNTDSTLRPIPDFHPIAILTRRIKSRPSLKNCQFCNCQVREDKLQGHENFRCPLRPKRVKMEGASAPTRRKKLRPAAKAVRLKGSASKASSDCIRYRPEDGEVEVPSWKNNLDATKNCGYPAREEGKYGSYPSHDGFDDESEP